MIRSLKLNAILAALSLLISACGGGGGGSGSGSGPVPSTPTPPPPETGFACPTSSSSSSTTSFERGTAVTAASTVMRRRYSGPATPASSNLLAVTYDNRSNLDQKLDDRAAALRMQSTARLQFDRLGRTTRVFSAGAGNVEALKSQLRAVPGVVSVNEVHRAYPLTRGATLTNDPYFKGESGAVPPLYQTTSAGGQWDMHIIALEHAFSYTEGSKNVKLAIIDTGEDVTHPDLSGATFARTQCFITDPNGVESTGSFVTDPEGHGTDVTGIAADTTDNGFGFAGAGGNVSLMLYRVFPTPVDSCATSPNPTDPHCGSSTLDIASAINDAVAHGANVISLSLGDTADTCKNGNDPDAAEGNAVANAIAHNVIVVAASGNDVPNNAITPPACDTGVIAVGASAYNDGNPNASSFTGTRTEYVPTYSGFGATNVLRNPASWGIVAPGGDGSSGSSSVFYLQWIENIWTTTPVDPKFGGSCGPDAFGESGNCRILITGTSMSTPHVAGAAALVLAVNPTAYGTPSAMKQLLCSTADSIGDAHEGCGRLNVYRAVAKASGDPNLP